MTRQNGQIISYIFFVRAFRSICRQGLPRDCFKRLGLSSIFIHSRTSPSPALSLWLLLPPCVFTHAEWHLFSLATSQYYGDIFLLKICTRLMGLRFETRERSGSCKISVSTWGLCAIRMAESSSIEMPFPLNYRYVTPSRIYPYIQNLPCCVDVVHTLKISSFLSLYGSLLLYIRLASLYSIRTRSRLYL